MGLVRWGVVARLGGKYWHFAVSRYAAPPPSMGLVLEQTLFTSIFSSGDTTVGCYFLSATGQGRWSWDRGLRVSRLSPEILSELDGEK